MCDGGGSPDGGADDDGVSTAAPAASSGAATGAMGDDTMGHGMSAAPAAPAPSSTDIGLSETESAGMPGTAEEAMGQTSDPAAGVGVTVAGLPATQATAPAASASVTSLADNPAALPEHMSLEQQIDLENSMTAYPTTTDSNTVASARNLSVTQELLGKGMISEEAAVAQLGQSIPEGGLGAKSPGGSAAINSEVPSTLAQIAAINAPSANPTVGYAINNPQGTPASLRASQAFAQVNPTLTNVVFGIAGMMPGPMGMMASLAGAHAGHGMMSLAEQMGVPGMGAISDVMTDIEESIMGTEANPSGIANAIGDIGAAIGGIGGTASIGESNADIGGPDEATLAGMSAVTPASQSFAQPAPSTAAIGSTISSFLDTSATTPLISIPGLSTAVLGVDEDLGATTPLSVLSPTGRGSSFRRSRTTSARDRAFGSANLFRPTLSSGISL
jgi:hypothetical protein